jgi:DNA-binding MarR family transcriptional regulator
MSSPFDTHFDAVVRYETALWNAVDRRITGDDSVRLGRLQVLRTIAATPEGVRVQTIADAVGTTIGAASRLVDRLLGDGLVNRATDEQDRRSVRVTLTEAGSTSLAATQTEFDAVLAGILAGADVAELSAATTAIERLQSVLDATR